MFNKSEYSNKKKQKKLSTVDLKISNTGSEERQEQFIQDLMSISSGQKNKSIVHSNRPWSHDRNDDELINIQIL